MSVNPLKSGWIKYLAAIAIFTTLVLIYFYPVLEKKVLKTNDTTVFAGVSKEIVDFREEYGSEPLWTNSMFSGMPAYLISTLYPGNLVKHFYNLLRKPGIPVAPILLIMAGFYFLLLAYRVDPWLAIAGAIAYGLSSYFFVLLSAGHNTKAMALAFMAPLIGSVIYAYRRNMIIGSLLTALMLSLEIISNHLQITYYIFMILLIFGISEFIHSLKSGTLARFTKTTALLAGAAIISVIVNFGSLYTTYEYGKYSIRGKSELSASPQDKSSGVDRSYATAWSYGIDETLTLLIPNIKGGATKAFDKNSETVKALRKNGAAQYVNQIPEYWGTQPSTSGPVYVGAIVVFLFIMGLVLVKHRDKWWLLIASAIAIMLAWGNNFMFFTNLFMDFLPGYSKFRAVTTILVMVQISFPLLAIIVLDRIFKNEYKKDELARAFKISGGITLGILILFLVAPSLAGSFTSVNESQYPEWLRSSIITDRKAMLRTDLLRSLFFVISAGTIIYMVTTKRIKKEIAVIALSCLFVLDMWPVDKRYLGNNNFVRKSEFTKELQPTKADNFIMQDKSVYRVLNLTVNPFSDGSTSYNHHSIGGYHGAKIRRYQDLIEHSIAPEINDLATRVNSLGDTDQLSSLFRGLNAINMLNTRYVIINPESQPLVNSSAAGNCWFVSSYRLVANPDEELAMVNSFDPAKEAIIDQRFSGFVENTDLNYDPEATIQLESYKPNELIYKYKTNTEQIALFSEIYYPEGWNAYLDGKMIDHFRVNYVLRAIVAPAGDHELVFRFEPESYMIGNRVSMAGSLLLIILTVVAGIFYTRRGKNIDKSKMPG